MVRTRIGASLPPLAGRQARLPRLSRALREELAAYLLISPWLFGFVVFTAGPIFASLIISFFDTNIVTHTYRWLGLANYATLFSRDMSRSLFWTSLYNTIY
jgi:multiple sugar transport system permease protein